MELVGLIKNFEVDGSLRRQRYQNSRSRGPICSSCSRSFGDEDWKNRGCYTHAFGLNATQGRSERSSSMRWIWAGVLVCFGLGTCSKRHFPGLHYVPVPALVAQFICIDGFDLLYPPHSKTY